MPDDSFRILTVCTMNICRSPALEVVLSRHAQCARLPPGSVSVASAGVSVTPGAPSCDISLAMVGEPNRTATSRRLSAHELGRADLVLTAQRNHISAVIIERPSARSISFTARSAARLATWVVKDGALDIAWRKANGEHVEPDREHPQSLTEPLPAGPVARLRWLVAEMDASRGIAPTPTQSELLAYQPDDIPDPHVVGYNVHRVSAELVLAASSALAEATASVLSR